MDKKLSVMKCCKGKTSSTTPPSSVSAPTGALTHTHTHGVKNTHTPLPKAHYLNPHLHLPLTLSSHLSPPSTHYSLITYMPPLSSPPPVPSLRLVVSLAPCRSARCAVSNSPCGTGLLTFHCTLRREGFLSLLTRRHSSSAVTARGAPWVG